MQPISGNLRPDHLKSLVNMSLVTAPATRNASLQILFKCPTPANVFETATATKPSRFAHFWQGAESLAHATQNQILTSKSGPRQSVFYAVHFHMCFAPQRRALFRHLNFQKFLDISTSKSAPNMRCLVHFDLEAYFAPQRRALFHHLTWSEPGVCCTFWLGNVLRATTACAFHHLNFQKWSEPGVLCTFWLRSVLRATAACNFSSLIWPAGCTRRFSEPTFRPSGATNYWKTQWIATFLPFRAPASSVFWLFLFSDLLSSSLLFSDSSHLCFCICPYCRKFDF